MAVMVRGNFPDLTNKNVDRVFWRKFSDTPSRIPEIFNIESTTQKSVTESEISELGLPGTKTEGDNTTYDAFEQMYDYTYTMTTISLGVEVTLEARDDDLHKILIRGPEALARSTSHKIEIDGANIFNRAFNGSYTYGDGVALCVTTHPKSSGTWANTLSTAADLDPASLEQALYTLEKTVDHRNLVLSIPAQTLLVPAELRRTAFELTDGDKMPYTSNNDSNIFKLMYGLQPLVWPRLSDADSWFLLAPKAQHYLKFIWRMLPINKANEDIDSFNLKLVTASRYDVGASGPRGVFGVAGA